MYHDGLLMLTKMNVLWLITTIITTEKLNEFSPNIPDTITELIQYLLLVCATKRLVNNGMRILKIPSVQTDV